MKILRFIRSYGRLPLVDTTTERRAFIGGHLPGYQQNRSAGGKFAPGDGGEHEGESGGGIHGPHGLGMHARSDGSGGGGSRGGHGRSETEAGNTRITRGTSGRAAHTTEAEHQATRAAAKGKAEAEGTGGGGKGPRASSGTRGEAGGAKAPKESVHETAARLQHEQGLKAEVQPTNAKGPGGQKLEAVGHEDEKLLDPYGPVNARGLSQLYGEHQLGAALNRLSNDQIRSSAKQLGLETTKTSKTGAVSNISREQLITNITAHVTEGRYSANFAKANAANREAAKAERKQAAADRAERTRARAEQRANAAPRTKAPAAPKTPKQLKAAVDRAQAKYEAASQRKDAWEAALHTPEGANPYSTHVHDLAVAERGLARAKANYEAAQKAHGGDSSSLSEFRPLRFRHTYGKLLRR